jgi:hypothetical protein
MSALTIPGKLQDDLLQVVTYAAEDDCSNGGSPGRPGCECIPCTAHRLLRVLWPHLHVDLSNEVVARVRDVLAGVPGVAAWELTATFAGGRTERAGYNC